MELNAQMSLSKLVIRLAAAMLLLAAGAPAQTYAQPKIPGYPDDIKAYDPREVSRLPPYCRYTQSFRASVPGGNDQAQIQHLYDVMGQTFHALHHYCWGLMELNRALYLSRSEQVRSFYLGAAIGDFDYVLERSSEDFVLRPEILTKKGQSLIALGRGAAAVPILEHAIELKPDYWPPYVQLSEYYKGAGKLDKAREVLEQALLQSPGVESLKQRLAELDQLRDKKRKNDK